MLPRTLNEIFFNVVERNVPRLMLWKKAEDWLSTSTVEFYAQVVATANALSKLGIQRGDRVAILSETRREWTVADFATLLIGGVVVPIYPTLTAEQTAFMLQDSGARAIFVSNEKQLAKVSSIRDQTNLEHVILMDEGGEAPSMAEFMVARPGPKDEPLERLARSIVPEDLATIIYTSGTTGVPKGVMLTHANMASNLACSLYGIDLGPGDVSVSYLPLSHITARHLDFAVLQLGVTVAYITSIEQLPQALKEVRPTIFVGVPRLYEKVHGQVALKTQAGFKKKLFDWALKVGRAHNAEVLNGKAPTSLQWKLANRLVFSKVREGMGGAVRIFISGGAPLGMKLAQWYADVGIRIHEGYGLTETAPVIALNNSLVHRLGTVGKPLSNVEVKIAGDGEILVRGPSIFSSYWNKPEETKAAFEDGWFRTGDVGNLDADGFLSVTDRKKDLIKTSGGKFIAPQPLENALKHNPLVAEAVVVGDKRRFACVLIAPNFPALEDWAKVHAAGFGSREELVRTDSVVSLYSGIVEGLNKDLAQFEKLKKVFLVAETFSTEDGTLTASMKLRRRIVEDRYRGQIEKLYEEQAAG
ncbi:MAG TPA: long-chain fatty acid--CoA ligase [Terriglobales bacterium]|nr:long-chain fatty acid--CoA ligase [Terriglobales bacterium]